jgi:hypothetical protein
MTVFFPQGIGQIAEMLISIKRLQVYDLYVICLCYNANNYLYFKLNIDDIEFNNL